MYDDVLDKNKIVLRDNQSKLKSYQDFFYVLNRFSHEEDRNKKFS